VHAGQDRPYFRRATRADDSNRICGNAAKSEIDPYDNSDKRSTDGENSYGTCNNILRV
jgi:hypothetical protein